MIFSKLLCDFTVKSADNRKYANCLPVLLLLFLHFHLMFQANPSPRQVVAAARRFRQQRAGTEPTEFCVAWAHEMIEVIKLC